MTDTFDNRLTRVPIYTSSPEDVPGPEPMVIPPQLMPTEAPPQEPWYSRAGNALLGVLDQFGVAGLPEGERREATREARNKLLHIGPMEEQDYLWPEKMLRSAVTLAGDVRTGNVPPPGLRREDYTDIPADPSKVGGTPHDDLIQRVQDMAGLVMTGGLAGTGAGGKVLGSGPVWYSPVEHALEATTNARATGAQWLATIRNSRGVKPEELDWTGLRQFLEERADKPVTRPELHEYLRDNRVELQDVTRGGRAVNEDALMDQAWVQADREINQRFPGMRDSDPVGYDDRVMNRSHQILERLVDNAERSGSTKYHDYALPGGENYREHLITMPGKMKEAQDLLNDPGRDLRTREFEELHRTAQGYRSSHWDEPNIVAHVRSNVREMEEPGGFVLRNRTSGNTTRAFKTEQEAADHLLKLPEKLHGSLDIVPSDKPIKKRSLHLEEVQSDWHQAGRRKGYKDPEIQKRVEELRAERAKVHEKLVEAAKTDHPDFGKYHLQREAISEEMDRLENSQHEGVPDAPWKKTWHELALRRMIRLAAEEGMDRISWTPGEAQAARYDLSKQLKELQYLKHDDGTYEIAGVTKDGGGFNHPERVKADKLSDIVGKEMAEKIVRNEGRRNRGQPANGGYFEGVDLKVGGEGMRGFYDKMMVQAAEKLGKEYGVKVRQGSIPGKEVNKTVDGRYSVTGDKKIYATRAEAEKAAAQPVWYFDIPPAMREAALGRGMPLFSGGKMFVPSGAQGSEEQ